MLFSEPKIPQYRRVRGADRRADGFQCSSASRKFLNCRRWNAEPSPSAFQCSSASRKFLNLTVPTYAAILFSEFQCSSASRKFLNRAPFEQTVKRAEFQCSSASRKFLNNAGRQTVQYRVPTVSVLFSEPKIPQSAFLVGDGGDGARFSALQRAENSSISLDTTYNAYIGGFSALQRAENSSILIPSAAWISSRFVSVLFSEPKIPQCGAAALPAASRPRAFQCSSASRKFLNSAACRR